MVLAGIVIFGAVFGYLTHNRNSRAPSRTVREQPIVGPAPSGSARMVASAAIQDADHPCGRVTDAFRTDTGGIRATCSNGEIYRVFTVQGRTVAMKCSAAVAMGISGC